MGTMLIQPYQEKWIKDFQEIKKVLGEVLANLNIRIEHVGSTSVPKLAAKPIIDIDIVYEVDVDFNDVKVCLEKLGYFHNGDQGIPEREAFIRHQATPKHAALDFINHHLYVCPADSKELNRHLLFRDYLISDSSARQQYEAIKIQIAQEADQDIKRYAEIKEIKARTFIYSIVEKAELYTLTSKI